MLLRYGLEPEFLDGTRHPLWRVGEHDILDLADRDVLRATGRELLGDAPTGVGGRVVNRWWLILYGDANRTERLDEVAL